MLESRSSDFQYFHSPESKMEISQTELDPKLLALAVAQVL